MDFITLDVETSNSDLASICQIGIAIFSNGILVNTWESLVNPEDYFDDVNISIHGITEKDIKTSPNFEEIYSELNKIIENRIVVIHTTFDKVAINRAAEKYNLPLFKCTWLDNTRIVRRTWKDFQNRGYGLSNIAKELSLDFNHHDAVEDARVTGEILIQAIKESKISLNDWLIRAYEPLSSSKADVNRKGNPDGALFGEVVVFTGALSLSRSQASELAANNGCDVLDGVNKKTTLLVVGDQDIKRLSGHEKSSKHRKAEDLIKNGQKIRILGESDFLRLIKNN